MVLKGNAQNAVYMCVWINFVWSNIFQDLVNLKAKYYRFTYKTILYS